MPAPSRIKASSAVAISPATVAASCAGAVRFVQGEETQRLGVLLGLAGRAGQQHAEGQAPDEAY